MQNQITIRPLQKKECKQAAALINAEYKRKKNENYFLWQYFISYYPAVLMGAFDGDTLVGMFGLQKKQLTNGAWAGQAMDLLIALAWRGKGLFKRMGDRALRNFDDLDLSCVFPNPQGKYACEQALGWTTIAKIDALCLSREEFERSKLKHGALELSSLDSPLISFHHTNAYHAWRFEQSAEYIYQYVKIASNIYAVTKLFIDPVTGTRYGDIVDMEYGTCQPEAVRELYIRACDSLFTQNVGSVTTWALPHTPLFRIAQTIGFAANPTERYFCVHILKKRYHILSSIMNWSFTQADCEMY